LKLKEQVVIHSINNDESNLCIDFFIRNNGTFGYEEFRRDPENTSGWYKVGYFANKVFSSKDEAYNDAVKRISWLNKT
tara:strand:- start:44 stop:277 length:234 start_codon:yes stop_codon:yes gene_type:complete